MRGCYEQARQEDQCHTGFPHWRSEGSGALNGFPDLEGHRLKAGVQQEKLGPTQPKPHLPPLCKEGDRPRPRQGPGKRGNQRRSDGSSIQLQRRRQDEDRGIRGKNAQHQGTDGREPQWQGGANPCLSQRWYSMQLTRS